MDQQTIAVTLPSSTVYVSGTVNDVSVVWTNTEGNTWQAIAARAEDDVYRVELTIIDGNGNSSTASTTIYFGLLSLITDRTAADVYHWQMLRDKGWEAMTEDERAEWLTPMKGCYNFTDLNRVEGAVEYIAEILRNAGYEMDLVTKKDWTMEDLPTRLDMARYIGNVAEIRAAFTPFPSTPKAPPISRNLNHEYANNLEQILKDMGLLATSISQNWHYAGDIFSGEV